MSLRHPKVAKSLQWHTRLEDRAKASNDLQLWKCPRSESCGEPSHLPSSAGNTVTMELAAVNDENPCGDRGLDAVCPPVDSKHRCFAFTEYCTPTSRWNTLPSEASATLTLSSPFAASSTSQRGPQVHVAKVQRQFPWASGRPSSVFENRCSPWEFPSAIHPEFAGSVFLSFRW